MRMTSNPRITAVDIGPMPQTMFDERPRVTATFEDGTTKELFRFYPDEIQFSENELVGLTEKEAKELRTKKDIAYLQS